VAEGHILLSGSGRTEVWFRAARRHRTAALSIAPRGAIRTETRESLKQLYLTDQSCGQCAKMPAVAQQETIFGWLG